MRTLPRVRTRRVARPCLTESLEQRLALSSVVAHHVFYNQSAWDGNDAAANAADDAAIATDKSALLPGQTATFANYTSYSRGINGIMVDIAGLPVGLGSGPGPTDFTFKIGNDNNPAGW